MLEKLKAKIKALSLFSKENKINEMYNFEENTKPTEYSEPFIISIKNTSNEKKEVTLFDFNGTYNKKNFGNDKSIIFNDNYGRIVAQSASNPFQIGKWRFQSEEVNNLNEDAILYNQNGNLIYNSKALKLSILLDAYQMQQTLRESKTALTVDGNTGIKINLLPSSELHLAIYPITIWSILDDEYGEKLNIPRTSAKNTPITIINTQENGVVNKTNNLFKRAFTYVVNLFTKKDN